MNLLPNSLDSLLIFQPQLNKSKCDHDRSSAQPGNAVNSNAPFWIVNAMSAKQFKPFFDNFSRRESPIIVDQIMHSDSLVDEFVDLVRWLADADHRVHLVFLQLLKNNQQWALIQNTLKGENALTTR